MTIRIREQKTKISAQIRVSKGTDTDGRTIYESKTISFPLGTSKTTINKEASKEERRLQELIEKGINTEKITFRQLAELYIEDARKTLKPKSIEFHEINLKRINKYIGHLEVKKIKKADIRNFIAELEKPYKTKNGKEKSFAPTTINDYIRTVSCVLSFGCYTDMLESNVCLGKGIRKPKVKSNDSKAIPLDVLKQYIEAFDEVFFYLALSTGARSGELCGLDWDNIDFENSEITIEENSQYIMGKGIIFVSPKTKASHRTIKVDTSVMKMLKELKAYNLERQLKFGEYWQANPDNTREKYCESHNKCKHQCVGYCSKNCKMFKPCNRVFIQANGIPLHPNTPYTFVRKFGKRHNLPPITIHGLRHTFVSLAIKEGEAVTQIASFVGHANVAVTNAVYAHDIEERNKAKEITTNVIKELKQA